MTKSVIKFGKKRISIFFHNNVSLSTKIFFKIRSIIVAPVIVPNITNSVFRFLARYFLDFSHRIITFPSSLKITLFCTNKSL